MLRVTTRLKNGRGNLCGQPYEQRVEFFALPEHAVVKCFYSCPFAVRFVSIRGWIDPHPWQNSITANALGFRVSERAVGSFPTTCVPAANVSAA
jgi:hypothetical protein